MNWIYVIAGAIYLFIGWQFSQADMISTSISCDGAALLSGSFIGLNQSYSQHLFTDDPLSDLRFTGPVESTIRVNGSGAIGMMSMLKTTGYRMSPCSSVPSWEQIMRRGDPKNWLHPD